MSINITTVAEYGLSEQVRSELKSLLEECFPRTFEGRTYFKQLPHLRLLAMDNDSVVGQVGIDGRVINVGGTIVPIFGIIDLGVRIPNRGNGIGTKLLAEVESLARRSGQDFLVAMADRFDLYSRQGFVRVQPAMTRFLAIDNRQSISVFEKDLGSCFLMKALAKRAWPDGIIDLLGYVF